MFYDIFISLCAEQGKKPSDISRDLGIRKSTISMWKKQNSIPNAITLMQLAEYFNVTPAYLAGNMAAKEPLHFSKPDQKEKASALKGERPKSKLRSVARLEGSQITPEQDSEIANYIDYLLTKDQKDL